MDYTPRTEAAVTATKTTPSPSAPSSIPPPAHQRDADEDDENVRQLGDCSAVYLALQECLIRTNRDWRSCQPEVQALKACHARSTKRSKEQ
ncbi:unnamed protein product [Spirodela intermedia]|uniref:Uncharacterized protein n=2 Tax=Spirodela intermedia TaxID=51605 RepID=A0A7I8JFV3_SPIIN|nr:unnamed protein product [Spirodela intermedia]CAA6669040.1 unnamed protein product [Spirodela intermedia]CAA7405984.1 unnamed protein product [Spirodela intermedia]